jgi:hypothetical protein
LKEGRERANVSVKPCFGISKENHTWRELNSIVNYKRRSTRLVEEKGRRKGGPKAQEGIQEERKIEPLKETGKSKKKGPLCSKPLRFVTT